MFLHQLLFHCYGYSAGDSVIYSFIKIRVMYVSGNMFLTYRAVSCFKNGRRVSYFFTLGNYGKSPFEKYITHANAIYNASSVN